MSTIQASHILLMYAGSDRSSATRTKAESQTQIDAIKKQLDAGEDFADLAKRHSDCPSGKSGGDLGSFGPGQMVKPFDDAARAMPIGGVSGVVETQFGYHIIKRTG